MGKMYKTYMDKIIQTEDNEKMEELKDLMLEMIEFIYDHDEKEYKKIDCELYEIAEGKVLNQEKAEKIVMAMRPEGMKWTMEETEQVRMNKNYMNVPPIDFWVVMNSAYNDYKNLFKEDVNAYAAYSYYFINDEDAEEDKVYEYFMKIPKK